MAMLISKTFIIKEGDEVYEREVKKMLLSDRTRTNYWDQEVVVVGG